jgi:hypothetical protein
MWLEQNESQVIYCERLDWLSENTSSFYDQKLDASTRKHVQLLREKLKDFSITRHERQEFRDQILSYYLTLEPPYICKVHNLYQFTIRRKM